MIESINLPPSLCHLSFSKISAKLENLKASEASDENFENFAFEIPLEIDFHKGILGSFKSKSPKFLPAAL